jgi:hypothetical protein
MKRTLVRRFLIAASKVSSTAAVLCLASPLSVFAGCSQSSGGAVPADGSAPQADGPVSQADGPVSPAGDGAVPQLGDPVTSCDGCPVCGGALASATTGVSFCTKDCTSDADCVTGTVCVQDPVSSQLTKECLKTCHANTDCSGIFVCRSDVAPGATICWSPYPPPKSAIADAGPDVTDSGAPDTGSAVGSDATTGSDGATDSSTDTGSTTPDASDSGSPG